MPYFYNLLHSIIHDKNQFKKKSIGTTVTGLTFTEKKK